MNQQPHSPRRASDDDASSKRLLWGFIFALLTFLLVVILVTSIDLLTGEAEPPLSGNVTPDTPTSDPSEPMQPSDPPSQPENPGTPGADEPPVTGENPTDPSSPSQPTTPQKSYLMYEVSGVTKTIAHDVQSQSGVCSPNVVVVDPSTSTVLGTHKADEIIYPASMTKVMTLLVACENLTPADYNVKLTMSADVVTAMSNSGASGWGLKAGDVLTVQDLLYAIAVESDGIASIEIAKYVAGSHEAFVQMMNERCTRMGLQQTKFVNATGLHDAGHYTTCREMASIMAAAMDHEQVATLLGEDVYVTRITHNGVPDMRATFYSTYYMRVMSPEFDGVGAFYALPNGARVIAAKTGTTPEAGHCLVSCIRTAVGKQCIVVTAGASEISSYCADLYYIYQNFAK